MFLGSFVAIPVCSLAQITKPLSLSEAITMSLQNNKQLKVNTARIQQAAAIVQEARERRLPEASVSGSYLKLSNPNIKLASAKDSGSSTGGGTGVSSALYGILNVSLPLYTGNKIRFGIESAKYLQEAVKLDAEKEKDEVILNTMDAYYNLVKSKAAAGLVKENLNESNERVNDFTNLEKNGVLARNDLLKAELQSSATELNLLDATNNWTLANINMNLMLGLPENTIIDADTTIQLSENEIKPVAEYEQIALQNRKEFQALSFRKKAAVTDVKATKAEYFPSLALTGGYVAAYIPHFITVTSAMNIGLGVKYNISSLWKKGKLQQVTAQEAELEAQEQQLDDVIRFQLNKDYQDYFLSLKKIKVYTKSIEQAEENYRISNNKYKNALLTTTELLDADVARLQAKLNYSFAKIDSFLAYNKLLLTAGILNSQKK